MESRIDLRPARNGYGLNGFVSNTVQVAKLRGNRQVNGGIYEIDPAGNPEKYPDHDRRYQMVAGCGYRSRNWWILGDIQVLSGLLNRLDQAIFGPQPPRTPRQTLLGLSCGFQPPPSLRKRLSRPDWLPSSFDVRIENMLNQRRPINLGSPFQGTRFLLPLRVLVGCQWTFDGFAPGKRIAKKI